MAASEQSGLALGTESRHMRATDLLSQLITYVVMMEHAAPLKDFSR